MTVAPLLTTKLYIPTTRPGLVPRPRLVEHVNAGLDRKLTLISAPAGFGKTTLVAEWLTPPSGIRRRGAWLSLDSGDNDPLRFWQYVIAALQTVDDSLGRTAQAALQSPEPPPLEPVVASLINDLAGVSQPIVLVLDDYHLIVSQAVHTSLNYLLDNFPSRLHLIITTRADPPLLLPRRRSRVEMNEIRYSDLRFTTEETVELINTAGALDLSIDDIAALESRTDGWIVGLQMAALSLKTEPDKHSFIAAFAGDNRYIGDYLAEEVLHRQPMPIQTFLLQTSILERLCGSLCDAVCLGDAGPENGQEILSNLERANIFIFPLDNERHWYRYHHLFADLLQKRLRQSMEAPEIARLHLRASAWYEKEGFIAEAVSHALASSDFNYAAALGERQAPGLIYRGETALTLAWLRALPEDIIRSSPLLCLHRAWSELYAPSRPTKVSADTAEQWARNAERVWKSRIRDPNQPWSADPKAQSRFAGNVAAVRARAWWRRGDPPEEIIRTARQALEYIPDDDPGLRSILLYILGTSIGEQQTAIQCLVEAREAGIAGGNLHFAMLAAFVQAAYLCYAGEFRRGASICREILHTIVEPSEREGHPLPLAAGGYAVLGSILLEWGEFEEAEKMLAKAAGLIPLVGNIGPIARQWWSESQVRLKRYRGDWAGASDVIERMELLEPYEEKLAGALRARLWLAQAEHDPRALKAAVPWAAGLDVRLGIGKQYPVEFLTLARLLIAQRRMPPSGRKPVDLSPLLSALEKCLLFAQDTRQGWLEIELLMLQALAFQALGMIDQALPPLERALTLAEPEGFTLLFLEEGTAMARLLYEAADRGIAPDYVGRLLAAFPDAALMPGRQIQLRTSGADLIEPLTQREIEVLRLIAEGLANREIAQRLVISPDTVKVHTRNIYGKLGVKKRTQAVAKARGLGILPS